MTRTITVRKDEETGEFYFDFEDLQDMFTNPELVDSYSVELREDNTMVLEFFDKDGNRITPDKI